jgi:hypothetical protein
VVEEAMRLRRRKKIKAEEYGPLKIFYMMEGKVFLVEASRLLVSEEEIRAEVLPGTQVQRVMNMYELRRFIGL